MIFESTFDEKICFDKFVIATENNISSSIPNELVSKLNTLL